MTIGKSIEKPIVAASIVVIAVLLLYAPTFASMASIWNRDATFTHGYLIPLLSGWLLWRDRAALAREVGQPDFRALWIAAAAFVGWLAADLIDVQVIRQAAATALIPIGLWFVLGYKWMRRALFPLLYLFFAVPFGDFLVPVLVRFTTEFTVAAVQMVGVPIYRDGSSFALPSGNFEVIKACSGVRYLIATIALGTLFAALSYRSWHRRLAFMALCLLLPIVANGFRAFGIVMMAHYSDMKYAVGFDHLIYGWIFFGFVMLLLFWIGGRFADSFDEELAQEAVVPHFVAPRTVLVFLVAAALAPAIALAARHQARGIEQAATLQLKSGSEVWRGPQPIGDLWRPVFAETGAAAAAKYSSNVGDVSVFARRYSWQSEGDNEATSAPLVTDKQMGWHVELLSAWSKGEHRVEVTEVFGLGTEHWRTWRWYLIDGERARSTIHAKWLELRAWLHGRSPQATILCVAISMRDTRSERADTADAALEQFHRAFNWQLIAQ